MTTIAFKDGILATDGRVVVGDTILTDDMVKILMPFAAARRAVAVCGDFAASLHFGEEIVARDWGHWSGDVGESTVIDVLLEEGIAIVYEGVGSFRLEGTFAYGTGRAVAVGAMLAGMDAPDAVEIAGLVDIKTGGAIRFCGAPGTKGVVCLDEYREDHPDFG